MGTIGWATGLKSCSEADINGGWSSWSEWTVFDNQTGCQNRSRICDNPSKCGEGLDCIGEASEIKTVNGGWSEWSEWSTDKCPIRSRICTNPFKCGDGLDCIGEASEIKTVNGGWSEWS